MAMRSCREWPSNNPNFIGVVIALLVVFFLYLYEFFIRQGESAGLGVGWAVLTCFFYLMSLWSFVAVAVTDPGKVPVMWGVYNNNPMERKFCLVCHNFKPERCHHCSKCGQCVLNMDHHCPWVNNCVGFFNRKYFLLFIFYLLLALLTAIIQMVIIEVHEITSIVRGERGTDFHTFLRVLTLLFCLVLFVTLFMFFHMHVGMVMENTTTLECMVRDRKRKSLDADSASAKLQENVYDIGPWYNFTQVFGENIFYWLLPVEEEYLLKGKGIFWEKRTLSRNNSQTSNLETLPLRPQTHPNTQQHSYGMYNY